MTLFVNKLKDVLYVENFLIRIRSDNYISQKMFEKMGAVRIGVEGKERAELMKKIMQDMGRKRFEETINEDFEEIQKYTICYKLEV